MLYRSFVGPWGRGIKLAEEILFPGEIQCVICVDLKLEGTFRSDHASWDKPVPAWGAKGAPRAASGEALSSPAALLWGWGQRQGHGGCEQTHFPHFF